MFAGPLSSREFCAMQATMSLLALCCVLFALVRSTQAVVNTLSDLLAGV